MATPVNVNVEMKVAPPKALTKTRQEKLAERAAWASGRGAWSSHGAMMRTNPRVLAAAGIVLWLAGAVAFVALGFPRFQ